MKIIALPDLHDGGIGYLEKIATDLTSCDLVLLVGDLTNSGRAAECARVIDAVRHYNNRILAVPGNWDLQEANEYLTQASINLHRHHVILEDLVFAGVGGSLRGPGTPIEYSERDFESYLNEAIFGLSANLPLILVSHQLPFNTICDRAGTGIHVGSRSVRTFIEHHQPMICFTGHIHAGVGIDSIEDTKIINPGPIWHEHYAYAEIIAGNVVTLEIRKI